MKLKTEMVQRFLESKTLEGLSDLTPKRHADNLRYFRNWLRRKRMTRKNTEKFIVYYQKGRAPATVNSAIATLKCFYRFLDEEKIFLNEIYFHLKSRKADDFFPIILTVKQVKYIINCPRDWGKYHKWIDRRKYDIYFMLLGGCGLRRGEALKLKVSSIDFDTNMLYVLGKGNKHRKIPLPLVMRESLQQWISDNELNMNDFIFQSRSGKPAGAQMFREELKKRLKVLGLDGSIHLHTFRHTYITEMHKANAHTLKAMKMVGHTSIETHMKYSHLVGEDLRDIAENHPINKILEQDDEGVREEPLGLPHFLKPKERQVN